VWIEPNGMAAREAPELRGLRRGGKCWGMKQLVIVVAALALASCGGKQLGGGGGAAGSSGNGGSSGAGGSTGTGGSTGVGGSLGSGGASGIGGSSGAGGSSGTPHDSGPPFDSAGLPEVGTSACTMSDGTCVLCNDDKWHCDDIVLLPCPPGAKLNGPCNASSSACFICGETFDGDTGNGTELQCGEHDRFFGLGFSCSQ
jgi:hypothetical protein